MISIARKRLALERASWLKFPLPGFSANYVFDEKSKKHDLFKWMCVIPGKKGGMWEGGLFELMVEFSSDYPSKPPKCRFKKVLFHPNIYPSGTVCLSILDEDRDWNPSITIRQILLGIQDLLDNPNILSPAQEKPLLMYQHDRDSFMKEVRKQVSEIQMEFAKQDIAKETKEAAQIDDEVSLIKEKTINSNEKNKENVDSDKESDIDEKNPRNEVKSGND